MTTLRPARLCSFGGGPNRSWTDLYTNHVYLSVIDPDLGVEDLLNGRFPDVVLPYFLHEATHHACLNSPLGMSIATVAFQARQVIAAGGDEAVDQARDLEARISVLVDVYRPVFEGLAMFAELDAAPGSADVASTPMILALDLFMRDALAAATPDASSFSDLWDALVALRAKADVMGRRIRLLSEPLADSDGYLEGYLAIKSFALWASLKATVFEDLDFTLAYLITHFCCDYGLVDLLLTPHIEVQQFAELAVRNLLHRFVTLYSSDQLETAANDLTSTLLAIHSSPESLDEMSLPAPPLGNDAATVQRATKRLRRALALLSGDARHQIARRGLLHLTSVPVDITFESARFRASVRGRDLIIGPIDPAGRRDGRARGSVDVFYETATFTQGCTVSVDGKVISRILNGEDEELGPWLDQFIVAREHVLRESDASLERFAVAAGLADVAEDLDRLVASTRASRDAVYQEFALLWVDEKHRDEFAIAAHEGGLADILGSRLTRSLAVLGAMDGLGAYLEEASLAQEPGADLAADLIEIADQFSDRFAGHPFVLDEVQEDGNVLTRVRAYV